jgi:DsbC/DsbD-like thiol-disulfide interchange protein
MPAMTDLMHVSFLAAAIACGALSPAGAEDSASGWAISAKSAARLIAAPASEAGGYHVGIEIKLSPSTITYWRSPGESGVSPVFDFSRSANLQSAEVRFPAPKRIEEAGSEIYGYDRDVVLPVRVAPREANKPVELALELDYAACEKICIPVHASLQLTVPSTGNSETQKLAAAEASVPQPLSAQDVAQLVEIAPAPGDKPTWRLKWRGAPATDLFAEGPDLFFIETKRAGDGFTVRIADHPKDLSIPDRPVRFTLTGTRPVEFALHLDGNGAAQ